MKVIFTVIFVLTIGTIYSQTPAERKQKLEEKILAEETARMDPANQPYPSIIQTIDNKLDRYEQEYLIVLSEWKMTASKSSIVAEKKKLLAQRDTLKASIQKEQEQKILNWSPAILETIDLKIARYNKELLKVYERIMILD